MNIDDPVHRKERASFVSQEAARWKQHHAKAFAALPTGTTVIIDITSGDYVTGLDWHAALDAFEQRFGPEDRFSHSFTVGRPNFIGGGIWLK